MMLDDYSFGDGFDELDELLRQFENLKAGRAHAFIDEDSFELLIEYYDERDELRQAMQVAELGVQQFPYSISLMLKKANLLIEARKYHQALTTLDQIEAMGVKDIAVCIYRTDAYLGLNQHQKAISMLQEYMEQFDGEDRVELLMELADVYDDCEAFDQVFECLKQALEVDPNHEEALHKICFWTDFTGRMEESIRLHTHIVNEYPYNHLAWFNLGTAFQELKLYEKAIDAYKYAVAINDRFEYAYRNLGDVHIKLKKYNEAIEHLNKVLEISKPDDIIYEAIGHCFEKQKKFDQARFHFRKAYHLNPSDPRYYYRTGITYIQENNYQEAIRYMQIAHKLNPRNCDYCLWLGDCHLQLEHDVEAMECYLDAIRIRPNSVKNRLHYLRALFLAGYLEEGLHQVGISQDITGDKSIYKYYQVAFLLELNRTQEALQILEQALILAPRQLKKLLDLAPSVLQHDAVVQMLARYQVKRRPS